MGRFPLPPVAGVHTKPLHIHSTTRHVTRSRSPHPAFTHRRDARGHHGPRSPATTVPSQPPSIRNWRRQSVRHLLAAPKPYPNPSRSPPRVPTVLALHPPSHRTSGTVAALHRKKEGRRREEGRRGKKGSRSPKPPPSKLTGEGEDAGLPPHRQRTARHGYHSTLHQLTMHRHPSPSPPAVSPNTSPRSPPCARRRCRGNPCTGDGQGRSLDLVCTYTHPRAHAQA
jgi:hypothetical protein